MTLKNTDLWSIDVWYRVVEALYEKWRNGVLSEIQSLIAANVEKLFIEGEYIAYSPKSTDALWDAYANSIKDCLEMQGFQCDLVSGMVGEEITPPSALIRVPPDKRKMFVKFKAFIEAGKVVAQKNEAGDNATR